MLLKKSLRQIPICERSAPEEAKGAYIAAHVHDIEKCGHILAAEIYREDKLHLRFFTDGVSFISQQASGEWTRNNPFNYWDGYGSDQESDKICQEFFGRGYGPAVSCIRAFVDGIGREKYEARVRTKNERKKRHFDMFPKNELGDVKIRTYINEVVFPNRYIVVRKAAKGSPLKCKCLSCGKSFAVKGKLTHRSTYVCPQCQASCTIIAERYISAAKDKGKFAIFRRCGDVVLKSYLTVSREYDPESFEENLIYVVDVFDVIENGKAYTYKWRSLYWVGWYHANSGDGKRRYVYADNLDEVIPPNEWHGLNLKRLRYAGEVNFDRLMLAAAETETAAKLFKIGLYRLAEHALDLGAGDTFESVLDVSANYKPLFRAYNPSYEELRIIRLSDHHVGVDEFLKIRSLMSRKSNYDCVNRFAEILKYMTFTKAINYFTHQVQRGKGVARDLGTLLVWYKDYIQMSQALNKALPEDKQINMALKKFRFPPNLKKAHDAVSAQLRVEKDKDRDIAVGAVYAEYADLDAFQHKGLIVMIPQGYADFIAEGHALSHCIGSNVSYIDSHIKKEKMSFFVREASDPGTSYYTFTVNMKSFEVTECHGKNHKRPTEEINECINAFIRRLSALHRQAAGAA